MLVSPSMSGDEGMNGVTTLIQERNKNHVPKFVPFVSAPIESEALKKAAARGMQDRGLWARREPGLGRLSKEGHHRGRAEQTCGVTWGEGGEKSGSGGRLRNHLNFRRELGPVGRPAPRRPLLRSANQRLVTRRRTMSLGAEAGGTMRYASVGMPPTRLLRRSCAEAGPHV
ncbi:MAG: hypothetical protein JWL90_3666 [Chthoniobacteraceae bacterium]|nr:hypothetical protein [Chthoniobacteraceae bacterium]